MRQLSAWEAYEDARGSREILGSEEGEEVLRSDQQSKSGPMRSRPRRGEILSSQEIRWHPHSKLSAAPSERLFRLPLSSWPDTVSYTPAGPPSSDRSDRSSAGSSLVGAAAGRAGGEAPISTGGPAKLRKPGTLRFPGRQSRERAPPFGEALPKSQKGS